jgi:flavin-dependent dehydrogenase
MQITCDVLVISTGPAGSTPSRFAAEAGAEVILLEKKKEIGVPVQCAEYIPWQVVQEAKLPERVFAQQIDFMQTHIPDKDTVKTLSKGFIIHRNLFDQALAAAAIDSGAKLLLHTKAIGYENRIVQAKNRAQNLEIKARIIIGADGPRSIVGKWMDSKNVEFIHTAQHKMPLLSKLISTEVYFSKDIPGAAMAGSFQKAKWQM